MKNCCDAPTPMIDTLGECYCDGCGQKHGVFGDWLKELKELIQIAHRPELAERAFVTILFPDGEICETKAGDLLWHRSLHIMDRKIASVNINHLLPSGHLESRYLLTDYTAAKEIRSHLGRMTEFGIFQSSKTCNICSEENRCPECMGVKPNYL